MNTDYTKAPTSYTPSVTTTPTFGQSGNAVLQLQQSINQKNAAIPGYVPLKEDGLYGPKTYAAANPVSELTSTSGSSRNTFTQNSSDLSKAEQMLGISSTPPSPQGNQTTPPPPTDGSDSQGVQVTQADPILSGLDTLKTANDNATNSLISTTQAAYQNKLNTLDKEFESYKGGLQLLGIQTNQAQASPDLLLGHIHQAALDQMDKVNALKSEEAKTIMDAKTAQANNDFKTLQDKMTQLKEIQTAKSQAVKDINTTIADQSKTATIEAHDIYDTLNTLGDEDKEAFIQAVANKFNLPLTSLVTALTDEQKKRTADDAKGDPVLTPTEAATLGVPYGTTRSQAETKKITPDRYKPTTKSSTVSEKDEVNQGKSVLKTGKLPDGTVIGNPQGSDGFVDPSVYTQLFSKWQGTAKDFVAKYPIKGTVNPASYGQLPEDLKTLLPKATKGSVPFGS